MTLQTGGISSHPIEGPARMLDQLERWRVALRAALHHALHAHQFYRFVEELMARAGLMRSETPEHTALIQSLLHRKELSIEYVRLAMSSLMEIDERRLSREDTRGQLPCAPTEQSICADIGNRQTALQTPTQTTLDATLASPQDQCFTDPESESVLQSIIALASKRQLEDPSGFHLSEINLSAAQGALHWYASTHPEHEQHDSGSPLQPQRLVDEFCARLSYLFESWVTSLELHSPTDPTDEEPLTMLMQTYESILASVGIKN